MPADLDRVLDTLLLDAGTVLPPSAPALATARATLADALATQLATQLATAARQDARPMSRRRPSRTAVLLAAAAVAASAAVIGPAATIAGHHPTASADAATVLDAAGTSAAEQIGGWPDAAYWHSTSDYVRDGRSWHREIWIGHDGRTSLVDPGVDPGVIRFGGSYFGPGLSWDQLYALPTDPVALEADLRRLDEGHGQNADEELFSTTAEMLGESPASPSLRRALYQVAAAVPGVEAEGTVTDRDGRTGQAVSRDGEQIVVDTATGQLLQDSQGADYVDTYDSQGPASVAP